MYHNIIIYTVYMYILLSFDVVYSIVYVLSIISVW